MTQNISTSQDCFFITAENITLDCQNHEISFSESLAGNGVFSNASQTTIQNCILIQSNSSVIGSKGVYFSNSDESSVRNVTVVSSGRQGYAVVLSSSNNLILSNNILDTLLNDAHAILLLNSTNNTNFITGILWDYSIDSGNNEYDSSDKEDIIFTTKINRNSQGA